MSSALALSSHLESRWEILSGAMKGTGRVMSSAFFTMGRSPECEFVIVNDPKCSRKHATVTVTEKGVEIRSLNERNFVIVNGVDMETAALSDGDIVTIGETEIRYRAGGMPIEPPSDGIQLEAIPSMPVAQPTAAPAAYGSPRPAGKRKAQPKKKNTGRYVILAIIGAMVWFVLSPTKKKPTIGPRTEQQEQADINEANELRDKAEKENVQRLANTVNARQAQENFVRGFRDYRKGQYERSMVSFQACLALNPDHALCNRYIRLSQRKFDELVQNQVVLGRKYRDQNQYKACRASFRNVMVMVKDANSKIYQEAKANYDACNAFVEGRY
jgi:hypothetical protein